MNRRQSFALWLLWLPLLVLALSIGVEACQQPAVAPCPDIVTIDTDGGADPITPVVPSLESDGGGEYIEPFDTPTGYAAPRCADACRNLFVKKCPEGATRKGEDSCYVVCKRAESTGKIDFKTDCVARATSQAGIRACGTYRCGAR